MATSSGQSSDSETRSKRSDGQSGDLADLALMEHLMAMRTNDRNHRRVEAHGDAELRKHYPDYKAPDEEVINWNSPTTVNHYPQGTTQTPPKRSGALAKIITGAAIAVGGAGAGYAASQWAKPAATATTIENTEGFIIEAGE